MIRSSFSARTGLDWRDTGAQPRLQRGHRGSLKLYQSVPASNFGQVDIKLTRTLSTPSSLFDFPSLVPLSRTKIIECPRTCAQPPAITLARPRTGSRWPYQRRCALRPQHPLPMMNRLRFAKDVTKSTAQSFPRIMGFRHNSTH